MNTILNNNPPIIAGGSFQALAPETPVQTTGKETPTVVNGLNVSETKGANGAPQVGGQPELEAPSSPKSDRATTWQRFQEALAKTPTSNVLFTAMELLKLLQEAASEEKKTARLARQADTLAAENAIQAQADKMRSAGLVGMIMGIAGGIVSAGMTLGSSLQGVKALSQKISMMNEANLPDLGSKALTAMNDFKAADTELTQVKTEVVAEQNAAIQTQYNADLEAARAAQPPNPARVQELENNPPQELKEVNRENLTPQQKERLETAEKAHDDASKKYHMASRELDLAEKKLHENPRYQEVERSIKYSDMVAGLGQALNTVSNGVTQGATTMIQAAGTAQQSTQKEAEASEQDDNELMQAAAKLQEQVLQILQQIYQSESQSFKEIVV